MFAKQTRNLPNGANLGSESDEDASFRRDLLRNPLCSPQFCGIMKAERRHRLHQHGKGKCEIDI